MSKYTREDFSSKIDFYGYMLTYKGHNIGGSATLDRPELTWEQARANLIDCLNCSQQDIDAIIGGFGQPRFYEAIERIDKETMKDD